jgi:hypothetical protein
MGVVMKDAKDAYAEQCAMKWSICFVIQI